MQKLQIYFLSIMIKCFMKFYLLLFFMFICFGCENNNQTEINNNITIIISNPNKIKTNIGTGINIKTLEKLNYDSNGKSDTLSVSANRYEKIYIKSNSSLKMAICKNYDTLCINISKKNIEFYFINRKLKKYDIASLNKLYGEYIKNDLLRFKEYKEKLFIKDYSSGIKSVNQNYLESEEYDFEKYCLIIKRLTERKNQVLSKTLKNGLISVPNFEYHKSKNNFEEFIALVEVYLKTENSFFKKKILTKYFKTDTVLNDDFIGYGYVNKLITDVILKRNSEKSFLSLRYNYKEAFDSLPEAVSGNLLKYAQFLCLEQMSKNNSFREFENYRKKYLKLNANKDMFQKLEVLKTKVSESLENLENAKLLIGDEVTNIQQVLKNNHNKVVYIDFWASWCKPCRIQMPFSKKLQIEYLNKSVVFVYISLDRNFDKWVEATLEEKLFDENYLATNYKTSSFYKKINLNSIPRYLIFDKQGKLEILNAPGPDTEEIRELLDNLLAN